MSLKRHFHNSELNSNPRFRCSNKTTDLFNSLSIDVKVACPGWKVAHWICVDSLVTPLPKPVAPQSLEETVSCRQ